MPCEEQITGIDEIHHAIAQAKAVTQKNASLLETAAEASEALQHQADSLTVAVSAFKVVMQAQEPAIEDTHCGSQAAVPTSLLRLVAP